MKNIIEFNTKMNCYNCKKLGFFIYTPGGANSTTCPICGDNEWKYNNYNNPIYKEYLEKYGYDYDDTPYYVTGNSEIEKIIGHHEYHFCGVCKIIYHTEHDAHYRGGCTDNIYNGYLVGEWEYQGNKYIGMPCFDNDEEYMKTIKDINILKMICPNDELKQGYCSGPEYKGFKR
jgi:hypothetical protein